MSTSKRMPTHPAATTAVRCGDSSPRPLVLAA